MCAAMPNPYRYTPDEMDDLVEQWHKDDYMVYSLEDFIMYETKFTKAEYDHWAMTAEVPYK